MFWIVRRTAAGIETLAAAISSLLVLVLALVLAFLLLLLLAAAAAAARACFCSARLSRTGGWTEANPERGAGRREEGRKEGEGRGKGGEREREEREEAEVGGEREREGFVGGFCGGKGRERREECVRRSLAVGAHTTLHYWGIQKRRRRYRRKNFFCFANIFLFIHLYIILWILQCNVGNDFISLFDVILMNRCINFVRSFWTLQPKYSYFNT